jgi:NADH pyrophosphatase NudC (nudix superfamily)
MEYAEDQQTMKNCPHFKAIPNPNHGQIKFIGHDGHETTYPPAGIAAVCGRCKTDCQSVAHTDDFGWVCNRCLASEYLD